MNICGKRIDSGRILSGNQIQIHGKPPQTIHQPVVFGTLDLDSVVGNTEKTSCSVQYDGQEYSRFNYGTGAASTALPVGLAAGFPLRKVVRVHRCERSDNPNFGRAKFQTVDEFGNSRKVDGHVTEVHTPRRSESEVSKYHDAFILEEFGALIPRHSRVSEGLRREYRRLCEHHGFNTEVAP